jgi:hypothetical protein
LNPSHIIEVADGSDDDVNDDVTYDPAPDLIEVDDKEAEAEAEAEAEVEEVDVEEVENHEEPEESDESELCACMI